MVTNKYNEVYILTLKTIFMSVAEDFTHRANSGSQSKGEFTVVLIWRKHTQIIL